MALRCLLPGTGRQWRNSGSNGFLALPASYFTLLGISLREDFHLNVRDDYEQDNKRYAQVLRFGNKQEADLVMM